MVIAISIMFKNKETYLPGFGKNQINDDWKQYPLDTTPGYPCDLDGSLCFSDLEIQQIIGNKEDIIGFSIKPNVKVHGILSYRGSIKGGYFFEGNILINILDANKKVLKKSNAVAKTEWMTAGPVQFEGNIDFTGLPKGMAYFEIHNDNASGLPENDKSILIPIVIE